MTANNSRAVRADDDRPRRRPKLVLRIGTTVGGYRVTRYLGHGWEGTAYLSREVSTGVARVLKFYAAANQNAAAPIIHTARCFERLRETGAVARYHHSGYWISARGKRLVYLVFDYLKGTMLNELVRQPRRALHWSADDLWYIAFSLTGKLAAAHRTGLAVGDFERGNNIVLVDRRNPVFCDIDGGVPGNPNRDFAADLEMLAGIIHRLRKRRPCQHLWSICQLFDEYLSHPVTRTTFEAIHFRMMDL
jgi:hypothetical protein